MALALRRHWGTFARPGVAVCAGRLPGAQTGGKSRPSAGLADARPIALVAHRLDDYPLRDPVRPSGHWPEPGGGEASPSSDPLSFAPGSNLLRAPSGDA